jgi:plastocyanin
MTSHQRHVRKEPVILGMTRLRTRVAAALAIALLGALSIVVGTGTAFASKVAKPAPVKITVTATEFDFKFSKASLKKPGKVIFTVINKGQIAHNIQFKTLHKTTKLLQPNQKTTLTVTFKKGSYYYLCTVPRHAEEGMAGSFKVL